jgi:hypothetical protein
MMFPWAIPSNATYLGHKTVNGQDANGWSWSPLPNQLLVIGVPPVPVIGVLTALINAVFLLPELGEQQGDSLGQRPCSS